LTGQTESHKIIFGMLKDRKDRALYRTTLYVGYELMEKLKDLAHTQKKTLTELINEALREYLQRQEPQEPAPKGRKK
jgi:metal-responsive CopG/Arc/MetJ family transcriptional regulator